VSQANPTAPADPVERATLIAAIKKVNAGTKLTQAERRAYDRHRKATEESQRWAYYGSIPKKHWVKMSGRQHRDLDRLQGVYGVPLLGATIDLAAVVAWLHAFLAENGPRLLQPADEDLLSGESTPMLERLREESWRVKRIERLKLEDQIISRELAHAMMGQLAAIIRSLGEQLQKKFGPDAHDMVDAALDSYEHIVESTFSPETSEPEPCEIPADPLPPGKKRSPSLRKQKRQ
jgi:hypothetical protein